MKGESLYKISALMGNSPEICRRHYAALIPESMYKSVEFKIPGKQLQGKTEDTYARENRYIGWKSSLMQELI